MTESFNEFLSHCKNGESVIWHHPLAVGLSRKIYERLLEIEIVAQNLYEVLEHDCHFHGHDPRSCVVKEHAKEMWEKVCIKSPSPPAEGK
jgi:hypothetical protein